jgi:hypothetical protein
MKQKIFALLFALSLTTLFTGCVKTADGHRKAGVPFAKDKIYSRYKRSADQIFTASRTVLGTKGRIEKEDAAAKTIKAKVDNRTVWVKSYPVPGDEMISEVVVQVRTKTGGGDIYLASEISKQIALQLVDAE